MHLSRDEILEAVCEKNSYEVFLRYEEWLDPEAYRESGHSPWPEVAEEQVSGRYSYRTADVPPGFGKVHPEVRLHSDGSSCDVTQAEINRLYFRWKESLVETSPG